MTLVGIPEALIRYKPDQSFDVVVGGGRGVVVVFDRGEELRQRPDGLMADVARVGTEEDLEFRRLLELDDDALGIHLRGSRMSRSLIDEAGAPRRKIGRNDLCVCGSRMKFKYCCAVDDIYTTNPSGRRRVVPISPS
jgi:hypothetical protein